MSIRVLTFFIILVAAGDIHAARSSPRNFKSLKQRAIEKEQAEKAAQAAAAENARHQEASSQTVEKVKFIGPKSGWGFVKEECVYYSPEGRNLGKLKAGTLFKYQDIKSTSKNDMLLSEVRDKSGWHGAYLLPCAEIAVYEGDPETVDIKIVADLRNYFLLKGKRDQHLRELLISEYKKNPHFEAYQRAVDLYNATVEKSRELKAEAAKLTGIKKARAFEELRELKYKQNELRVNLETIGAKYKAWKERHSLDTEKIKDGKLLNFERKIAEIKKRIPELIPPEE